MEVIVKTKGKSYNALIKRYAKPHEKSLIAFVPSHGHHTSHFTSVFKSINVLDTHTPVDSRKITLSPSLILKQKVFALNNCLPQFVRIKNFSSFIDVMTTPFSVAKAIETGNNIRAKIIIRIFIYNPPQK